MLRLLGSILHTGYLLSPRSCVLLPGAVLLTGQHHKHEAPTGCQSCHNAALARQNPAQQPAAVGTTAAGNTWGGGTCRKLSG